MPWPDRALCGVALIAVLSLGAHAHGEEVVTVISDQVVSIDTAFSGAAVTFAGQVRPATGADPEAPFGAYHVVIVVRGPAEDRMVWGAEPHLGIWLNSRQAKFEGNPGFYWILASGPLDRIIDNRSPSRAVLVPLPPFERPDRPFSAEQGSLSEELRRLMTEGGLYGRNERGVQFLSTSFYMAQLTLPQDAPTGLYVARTYVLKDGIVVARNSESFSVRMIGFERFLAVAASSQPLLYGLACVVLALATGWIGGVVFRR